MIAIDREEAPSVLSSRQQEVLELRLQGRGRRQIADTLGISPRTVRDDLDRARATVGAADELDLLIRVDRTWRQS